MKNLLTICTLCLLSITSCGKSKEVKVESNGTKIYEDDTVRIPTMTSSDSIKIFDVKSSRNSVDFFNQLSKSSFITVEEPVIENDKVQNAIIYFNGTGFGATPMYDEDGDLSAVHLISSKSDDENYEHVKDAIMYFYGEKEDDEWHTCRWVTDSIQIKLRPLHSDESGTVMMWMF
jgi:hypothetical protein